MFTPPSAFAGRQLLCENVRLTDIARQFGTPAYVLPGNHRRQLPRLNAFAASKPLICYAVKANSTLSVLALLAAEAPGSVSFLLASRGSSLLVEMPAK